MIPSLLVVGRITIAGLHAASKVEVRVRFIFCDAIVDVALIVRSDGTLQGNPVELLRATTRSLSPLVL